MKSNRGWRRIVNGAVWMALGFLLAGQSRANAANVLLLSTGNDADDQAIQSTLQGFGHSVDIGPQYNTFDGSNLATYNAVLLAPNYNYNSGDMPAAGQMALLAFIGAGGGLVTGEWMVWKEAAHGSFVMLSDAVPVAPSSLYRTASAITYATDTADDILNSGVDPSFMFTADDVSGTETLCAAKSGATVFYDSDYQAGAGGVIGWIYGSGAVISISTVIGPMELQNPNYAQLLANAVTRVTTPQ